MTFYINWPSSLLIVRFLFGLTVKLGDAPAKNKVLSTIIKEAEIVDDLNWRNEINNYRIDQIYSVNITNNYKSLGLFQVINKEGLPANNHS